MTRNFEQLYYALRDAIAMYAGDGIISDDALISMATEQASAFNSEPTVDRLQRLRQAMLNDAQTFREFDGNDIRGNIALAYAARVGQILPPALASPAPDRLYEFAEVGARSEHRYYTDGIETLESNGHRGRFDDCPHADCQEMRAYLASPAPPKEPTHD